MKVFLGDQSVKITKVFIFVFEDANFEFVLFRVLVGAQYRGATSAS